MRTFIILIAALFAIESVVAQDLLVKRNGEQMRVKILKITKKKVQFVRHGTELPIYTLPITDIDYIEYPMGDRDTFGRNASTIPQATTAAASKENGHYQQENRQQHCPQHQPSAAMQVSCGAEADHTPSSRVSRKANSR